MTAAGYTIAGSGDARVKIAWPTANPANVADYSGGDVVLSRPVQADAT